MASFAPPLAALAAAADGTAAVGGGAVNWLQVIGGTLAVFALLVLCLRLLARWQGGPRHRQAALLAVLSLGPRREIQVVRLREHVHYIYRNEGALLALERETYAEYAAAPCGPEWGQAGGLIGLLRRRLVPGADPAKSAGADRENRGR